MALWVGRRDRKEALENAVDRLREVRVDSNRNVNSYQVRLDAALKKAAECLRRGDEKGAVQEHRNAKQFQRFQKSFAKVRDVSESLGHNVEFIVKSMDMDAAMSQVARGLQMDVPTFGKKFTALVRDLNRKEADYLRAFERFGELMGVDDEDAPVSEEPNAVPNDPLWESIKKMAAQPEAPPPTTTVVVDPPQPDDGGPMSVGDMREWLEGLKRKGSG